MTLPRELRPHSVDNLPPGGDDPERRERSAVDHGLTIHEHLVLAVLTVDHVDLDPQVTPELRRHTDGVQTRQSVGAVPNANPGHLTFLRGLRTAMCVRHVNTPHVASFTILTSARVLRSSASTVNSRAAEHAA